MAALEAALEDINLFKGGSSLRIVNGYTLLELVGRGAFGSVYHARKDKSTASFALKELSLDAVALFGATTEERTSSAAEVANEVEILSGLVHPNIVRYYESFVEDCALFIVMELVDGVSLMDHINSVAEKGQKMPEAHIWQVLVQLCLALTYIHVEKGIVHRDVTPSNVLLDHSFHRAKLADFGLAKQKSVDGSIMRSAVGTITYCCPEIVQHADYTDKADIWSLGCILYTMMALRPPFEGTNPITVASRIVEGKYEPLGAVGYSARLTELLPWLLERNADKRPSVTELSSRLSPRIMTELVSLSLAEDRLLQQLASERDRRTTEKLQAQRNQYALQRLLQMNSAHVDADSLQEVLVGVQLSVAVSAAEASSEGTPPRASNGTARSPISHAPVASPKLTIKQNRLRPINDPLAAVLGLVHKLVFIERLPPALERDPRRRCVERYVRHLFGPLQTPGAIKTELLQLLSGSQALVDVDLELGFTRPSSSTTSTSEARLTYDELSRLVEGILRDKDYYKE